MEMIDNGSILGIGGEKLDRLSDLPFNIKHMIQDKISIEDAARMSILSTTWRDIWASNPKLIFDTTFFTRRLSSNAIDIISTILFQHHGSIKTFVVDISVIQSSQQLVVDRWMLFLSRNGLMDLTIQNQINGNAPYKLPSYVYDIGLEHLSLSNCIFRPPRSFRGFNKLKWLLFTRVPFELEVASSSLWMPNLERLGFENCFGLHFLNINAPKATGICLSGCGIDTLNLSPFMNSEKMKFFAFVSDEEVSLNRDKTMKLTDLLSSWPNLVHLIFGRCFLKLFASCTGVESPPLRLTSLRAIHLSDSVFDSEDQIFALLSILRSFPNIMILHFYRGLQRKKDEMEVDVNSLQVPDYRIQQLNNLRRLKIYRFCGSRNELLFISLILASAPSLLKAILLVDSSVNESQSLKISKELMRFPRASSKSEIICEPQ